MQAAEDANHDSGKHRPRLRCRSRAAAACPRGVGETTSSFLQLVPSKGKAAPGGFGPVHRVRRRLDHEVVATRLDAAHRERTILGGRGLVFTRARATGDVCFTCLKTPAASAVPLTEQSLIHEAAFFTVNSFNAASVNFTLAG